MVIATWRCVYRCCGCSNGWTIHYPLFVQHWPRRHRVRSRGPVPGRWWRQRRESMLRQLSNQFPSNFQPGTAPLLLFQLSYTFILYRAHKNAVITIQSMCHKSRRLASVRIHPSKSNEKRMNIVLYILLYALTQPSCRIAAGGEEF